MVYVPVYDYDSGMIVHDSQMIGRRAQLCGDTGQMDTRPLPCPARQTADVPSGDHWPMVTNGGHVNTGAATMDCTLLFIFRPAQHPLFSIISDSISNLDRAGRWWWLPDMQAMLTQHLEVTATATASFR